MKNGLDNHVKAYQGENLYDFDNEIQLSSSYFHLSIFSPSGRDLGCLKIVHHILDIC